MKEMPDGPAGGRGDTYRSASTRTEPRGAQHTRAHRRRSGGAPSQATGRSRLNGIGRHKNSRGVGGHRGAADRLICFSREDRSRTLLVSAKNVTYVMDTFALSFSASPD